MTAPRSLAAALESAAEAMPALADAIRPANGDPERLLDALDAPAASQLLSWLLAHAPEAGDELALAWADAPRGIEPLRAIDAAALDKAGRKALRRAHHRLRSRGVEVGEAAPREVVAQLPRLDDELAAALVSPPDPSGAQLVVIVEPNPSGGARLFQAAIDLERGVLEFHAFNANRSQARRLLRELSANRRLGAVPVTRDAAGVLLARAAAAQPADRALAPAFNEWRSHLAEPAEGAASPGEAARAALAVAEPAPLGELAERAAQGAFGPWPPTFEALRAIAERVRKTAESPLLVDDAQRRAQVDGVLGDALDERYAGDACERTAQRLEECAYGAWKQGRCDEAKALLAAARAFRERPPRDNPVARALLERSLGPMLEALRDEQAASLLVKP